ncbi:MAG: hypothetical protein ACPGN3_10235 [Opitutales bacterium]
MRTLSKNSFVLTGAAIIAFLLLFLSLNAQVFTPFKVGSNPPLTKERPKSIKGVKIDGRDITEELDGFHSQSRDIWYDWTPVKK